MQGQRGTLQFLPENLEYERPSSSNMASTDHQQGFRNGLNVNLNLPGRSDVNLNHRHRAGSSSRQPPPIYSSNYNGSETSSPASYAVNSQNFGGRIMESQGYSLPSHSRFIGMYGPSADTPSPSLYHHFPPEDPHGVSTSGFSSTCGVLAGDGSRCQSDESNGSGSSAGRCHCSKRKSFDGQSSGSSSGSPVSNDNDYRLRWSQGRNPLRYDLNLPETPVMIGTNRIHEGASPYSRAMPQQQHFPDPPNPIPQAGPSASSYHPLVPAVPALPQVVYPIAWGGLSNSRLVGSSDLHLNSRTGTNGREFERNSLPEYPMFAPSAEFRPLLPPDPRNQIPGDVDHFSLFNPIPAVIPPVAPGWISHQAVAGQVSSSSSSLRPNIDARAAQEQWRSSFFEGRRGNMMVPPFPPHARHVRNLILFEQLRNALELMRREQNMLIDDVMIMDESSYFDIYRDMRLDVDNMSYEELLALEERIGNVSTGVDKSFVQKNLKQKKYLSFSSCKTESCCICQEDYEDGDELGILSCGHDFHASCVGKWLVEKNVCPICKTTALPT